MITGIDVYRAVNLARELQGLPQTSAAPVATTVADEDLVTAAAGSGAPPPVFPLAVHVDLTWARGSAPGGGPWCLMVWAWPRLTAPGGMLKSSGYSWCGSVPVVVGVPVRIDGILIGRPVVVVGGWLAFLCGICEQGLSPFAISRAGLRNRAE